MISTFWAFAGLTSVHSIYSSLLHTFVLTDLLLVAMLLADGHHAARPVLQGRGQAQLPRL